MSYLLDKLLEARTAEPPAEPLPPVQSEHGWSLSVEGMDDMGRVCDVRAAVIERALA